MVARTIPSLPHPSSPIAELPSGRASREWFDKLDELVKALQHRVPLAGTVAFSAATTAAVTFTTAEPNTSYNILIDAPEQRTVWVTNKTTSGFTVNVSSSSSATYGWTLIRQ